MCAQQFTNQTDDILLHHLDETEIAKLEEMIMDIKSYPFVFETEKSLSLNVEIKNRLNPYIFNRIEKLTDEGTKPFLVTEEWMSTVEQGCQMLIADMNLRKSLAREHLVNYIIQEYGSEPFGQNQPFKRLVKPDVDEVVKRITKELRPKKRKSSKK